jgi:hypothetical protein
MLFIIDEGVYSKKETYLDALLELILLDKTINLSSYSHPATPETRRIGSESDQYIVKGSQCPRHGRTRIIVIEEQPSRKKRRVRF